MTHVWVTVHTFQSSDSVCMLKVIIISLVCCALTYNEWNNDALLVYLIVCCCSCCVLFRFTAESVLSTCVKMYFSVLMEPPFQDAVKMCELEDQLHERDVELTESRLQSLASSHRIEQLQERITDLEVLLRDVRILQFSVRVRSWLLSVIRCQSASPRPYSLMSL